MTKPKRRFKSSQPCTDLHAPSDAIKHAAEQVKKDLEWAKDAVSLNPCRLCGCMSNTINSVQGWIILCRNGECRLSECPTWPIHYRETYEQAVCAWNGEPQ